MKTSNSAINTAIVYKAVRWNEDNQGDVASLTLTTDNTLLVTTPDGIRYQRSCSSQERAEWRFLAINGLSTAILQANGFEVVS